MQKKAMSVEKWRPGLQETGETRARPERARHGYSARLAGADGSRGRRP